MEAIKISELGTGNISAAAGKIIEGVYRSISKVPCDEVTERKQHVIQPHREAFSALAREISSQS